LNEAHDLVDGFFRRALAVDALLIVREKARTPEYTLMITSQTDAIAIESVAIKRGNCRIEVIMLVRKLPATQISAGMNKGD
jgi:hypothetical protein